MSTQDPSPPGGRVPAPGDAVAWAYRQDVSGSAKFTLVTVALYASLDEDDRWTSWPSRRTLAENVGVSVDRVKQILRGLVDAGLLVKEGRERPTGATSSTRYVLALPGGSPLPPGGEPATRGRGEPATPQCEPPQGTTTEPSPVDPPITALDNPTDVDTGKTVITVNLGVDDPRVPRTVNRRAVSKADALLAVRILDYWQARTGVAVTGTDVARAIIGRLREDGPTGDEQAAFHKRVIDANLARPWWGNERAAPNVLYGNGKAWAAAKARASGRTDEHPDQTRGAPRARQRDAVTIAAAIADQREAERDQ